MKGQKTWQQGLMGEQQRERTCRRLRGLLQLLHLVGLRPIRSDGAFGCLPVDRRCRFHLAMNQVMAQITAEQTFTVRASFPQELLAYLLFPDLSGVSSDSGAAAVIFSDLLETKKRVVCAADKCVERPLKCYVHV